MNKINLWAMFSHGHAIRSFDIAGVHEKSILDVYRLCQNAKKAIDDLCDDNPLQLSETTLSAATRFQSRLDESLNILNETGKYSLEKLDVHSELAVSVFDAVDLGEAFQTAFAHECEELNTFFVPQKGTHHTASLMNFAVKNLSNDTQGRLSSDATADINAAGRCLALDAPTASGFHMLRATEALMRDYYTHLTSKTLHKKHRNWGRFIGLLETSGADTKVTGFLTHIKDFYRNPLMHPEDTLTPSEAFGLFNASLSAITMLDAAMNP